MHLTTLQRLTGFAPRSIPRAIPGQGLDRLETVLRNCAPPKPKLGKPLEPARPLIVNLIGEIQKGYAQTVRAALAINPSCNVELFVESIGGDLGEAFQAYDALRGHKGKVEATIFRTAFSAAGIVAMGADRVLIHRAASMMLHDARPFSPRERTTTVIKKWRNMLADAYAARARVPRDRLLNWIRNETYLSAADCVRWGFADDFAD